MCTIGVARNGRTWSRRPDRGGGSLDRTRSSSGAAARPLGVTTDGPERTPEGEIGAFELSSTELVDDVSTPWAGATS